MIQIFFLDTNVILDYLENRNQEVRDIVAQLLLFHKNGSIELATSVFNMAEVIDKEFQIHHIGTLLSNKMSYDEVLRQRGKKNQYREEARGYTTSVKRKIKRFIFDNDIKMLDLEPFQTGRVEGPSTSTYEELYDLIYSHQFASQDALIIGTALCNGTTYFLSNDTDIVNEITENGILDAYNLRDPKQRKDFKDNVLQTLVGMLR